MVLTTKLNVIREDLYPTVFTHKLRPHFFGQVNYLLNNRPEEVYGQCLNVIQIIIYNYEIRISV